MKKEILLTFALVFFYWLSTSSQTPLNQACNWPFYSPNGVGRTSSDNTSEDWWYDIKALDSSHLAYSDSAKFVACGYSTFDEPINNLSNYYSNDPCFNYIGNDNVTDGEICDFELKDMKHLNLCGTIGLFNINSTSSSANPYKWIYNYGNGSLFRKVIPTDDGGFLATGYTYAFKVPGPLPTGIGVFKENQFSNLANSFISYQAPNVANTANTINNFNFNTGGLCNNIPVTSEEFPDPNDPTPKHYHACLIKVDKDGKVVWYYKYGIEPFSGSGDNAYLNSSIGSDVVEVSDGYIMVGALENYAFYGNYGGRGFVAKVNKNGILQWIKRYPDASNTGETSRFLGVKTKKINGVVYAYVVGERTTDKLSGASGYPKSSYYLNSSTQVYHFSYTSIKMEPFLKKIDVSSSGTSLGQEKWTANLKTGTGLNHRSHTLTIDNAGNILVPVLTDCKFNFASGECKNSKVFKILDLGTGTTDYSVSTIADFGPMRAYDLYMSIMATTDGGFSVASTKKAYDLNISKNYSVSPFLNGYDYSGCNIVDKIFYQTDAFVAKCNSSGSIQWTSLFDNLSLSGGLDGGNLPVSPLKTIGNPRSQTNLDLWMNKTSTRSKKDIKREECLFAITTSLDGNILVGGSMSSNIDDSYSALIQNNCQLDMSYHLIQAIPSYENSSINVSNVKDLISSVITTGRKPGNLNEVAEFVVNNNAVLNIEAGQYVDMFEGTDLGFSNSTATPLATADADVDIHINSSLTCTAGNVKEYKVPKGTADGFLGRNVSTSPIPTNKQEDAPVIYPNPTTGLFTIDMSSVLDGNYNLVILDVAGRELKKSGVKNVKSAKQIFYLSISDLSPGSYILRIEGKNFSKQTIIILK